MRRRLEGLAVGLMCTLVFPLLGSVIVIGCALAAVLLPFIGLFNPGLMLDRKRRPSTIDELDAAEKRVEDEVRQLSRLAKNAAVEGEVRS